MISPLLPVIALVRRELLSSLRQRRYFFLIAIAAAIALIAVASLWPRHNAMLWEMRNAAYPIFAMVVMTLIGAAALILPAIAGASIVSEREEDTFELLAMTCARPWQVIVAKLINCAGHYLLMIVTLAPAAATVYFLVGINTSVIWHVFLLLTSTAMVCAAAGVLCSAVFRRTLPAIGASYVLMITIIGVPLLIVLAILELFGLVPIDPFLTNYGMYIMPSVAMIVAFGGGPGGASTEYPVEICSALCTVAAVAFVLLAHVLVRRRWGTEPRPVFNKRENARRRIVASPPRRFGDSMNPILLREWWYDYSLHGWVGVMMFWLPLMLALAAGFLTAGLSATNNNGDIAFIGWQYLQAIYVPTLLVALTANLFTKERERENLDALRMTLLTPNQIAGGKIGAMFVVMFVMIVAVTLGSSPVLMADNPFRPREFAYYVAAAAAMLIETTVVAGVTTAVCSMLSRRIAGALVAGFIASATLLIGIALLLLVVDESVYRLNLDTTLYSMASPYIAFVIMLDNYRPDEYVSWLFSHTLPLLILVLGWVFGHRIFAWRCMCDE